MAPDGYAYTTTNTNYQYFSTTGTYDVIFTRSVSTLIVTFSGTNNMSLDGTNYMSMTAGTYQFTNLGFVNRVCFTGGGTRVGFGIAL
jgi:hypothetical protein